MNDDNAHPPRWLVVLVQIGLVIALVWSTVRDCAAADEWTRGEKVGEAAYLMLHTVDWMQTRYIAKHPACGPDCGYTEINPVLGVKPTTGKVDAWFAVTTIAQPLIANALPRQWREPWIAAGVVMEFTLTTHNASIGIRMDMP